MLIRNQDKTGLINLRNIVGLSVVKKVSGASKSTYECFEHKYYIQAICNYSSDGLLLGEFSYKSNAIKVLDMIQEQHQYIEECKYVGVGSSQPEFIFGIPTDEECER